MSAERPFSRVLLATIAVQAFAALPYAVFAAMQSRMLGAEGRGDVAVVVTATFLAVAVADLGYTAAMPFQIGAGKATSGALLGNFLLWSLVSVSVVFVGLLVMTSVTDVFGLGAYVASSGAVILAMMVANQLYNFACFEALSWKDYSTYNTLAAVSQGTMPVVLGVAYLVSPASLSVNLVVASQVFGYGAGIAASVVLARSRLRMYLSTLHVRLALLAAHLRVGARSFLSVLAGQLLQRLDILLLLFFLRDPREVGFYSIAVLALATWNQIPGWVATVLWPKVAHADPGHRSITISLAWAAFGAGCLAAATLLALAPILPSLFEAVFGPGFAVAYGLLILMTPRLILSAPGEVLAANLAGKGYGVYHPLAAVLALVASVALNLVLIPRYGIYGAAVALALSYVVQFSVIVRGFCAMNRVSLGGLLFEGAGVLSSATDWARRSVTAVAGGAK